MVDSSIVRLAIVAALSGGSLISRAARADIEPIETQPSPAAVGQPAPAPPNGAEQRSIAAAVGLSVIGTIVGIAASAGAVGGSHNDAGGVALGLTLLSVGPSAGELYAGAYIRAALFSSLRGLCSGLIAYWWETGNLGGEQPDRSADDHAAVAMLSLLGLVLTSVIDAGIAVDDFNQRHRPPPAAGLTIGPLLAPARAPDSARVGVDAGLTLSGRF